MENEKPRLKLEDFVPWDGIFNYLGRNADCREEKKEVGLALLSVYNVALFSALALSAGAVLSNGINEFRRGETSSQQLNEKEAYQPLSMIYLPEGTRLPALTGEYLSEPNERKGNGTVVFY